MTSDEVKALLDEAGRTGSARSGSHVEGVALPGGRLVRPPATGHEIVTVARATGAGPQESDEGEAQAVPEGAG